MTYLLGCNNDKPVDRSVILQIARNKYFFLDDGTPSLRLVEDEDDNGKTIEEPELYRPLHMDDFSYNEQCEVCFG
jgi:hypothetical protein